MTSSLLISSYHVTNYRQDRVTDVAVEHLSSIAFGGQAPRVYSLVNGLNNGTVRKVCI